jgi:hypothetical protein
MEDGSNHIWSLSFARLQCTVLSLGRFALSQWCIVCKFWSSSTIELHLGPQQWCQHLAAQYCTRAIGYPRRCYTRNNQSTKRFVRYCKMINRGRTGLYRQPPTMPNTFATAVLVLHNCCLMLCWECRHQVLEPLSLAVKPTHFMSRSLGVGYMVDSLAAQPRCQRSSSRCCLRESLSLIMLLGWDPRISSAHRRHISPLTSDRRRQLSI